MTKPVDVTTPSDREIDVTRRFDAPAQLVFDFHTKPEHVKKWLLGPDGWTMPVCSIDLKVGGRYEYVWRHETDGRQFGVRGEYLEITPPHRIVHTEVMDGRPGNVRATVTFSESAGGRTTLTMSLLFDSKEDRDAALESGMTGGMAISFDRLEACMI
jgi:uncharacterized protein YndB with AHSA1/START domain